MNNQQDHFSPNSDSPDDVEQVETKKKPAGRIAVIAAVGAVLLIVCSVCIWALLPSGTQDTAGNAGEPSATSIARIPQYEYDGKFYLASNDATANDAGELLEKTKGGVELYRYKPIETTALLVSKQGENYSLCQFIGLTDGNASGKQLLAVFEGNGGISSIEFLNDADQLAGADFEELFSALPFSDTPLFDHSVEDCIMDGAVCHVPTIRPVCKVTYQSGVSFEVNYDTATGLLHVLGTTLHPSEEAVSLLGLDSMTVLPESSPNS